MKKASQSRSLQFAVTGALLVGVGAPGDLACAVPGDPNAIIEEELAARTAGDVVVNVGPANPPRPLTAPPPGIVNPGPVSQSSTMR